MRETLLKAASLLREAAESVRSAHSPEKMAAEVADQMVLKGLVSPAEKGRYASALSTDPTKLAALSDGLAAVPSSYRGSLGEPAQTRKTANAGLDAWDAHFGS